MERDWGGIRVPGGSVVRDIKLLNRGVQGIAIFEEFYFPHPDPILSQRMRKQGQQGIKAIILNGNTIFGQEEARTTDDPGLE